MHVVSIRKAVIAVGFALLLIVACSIGAPSAADAQYSAGEPSGPESSLVSGQIVDGELPRTGPQQDPSGLGAFGFVLLGVGLFALLGSRRLLADSTMRR